MQKPTGGKIPGHDRSYRRSLGLLVAGVAGLVFAFLLLRPVVRFFAFLLSGDVWRALVGAGFIALCLGIGLIVAIGRFEPRRMKGLLRVSWALIFACPLCLLVALVGSGWLLDIIRAIRDLVPRVRHLL